MGAKHGVGTLIPVKPERTIVRRNISSRIEFTLRSLNTSGDS